MEEPNPQSIELLLSELIELPPNVREKKIEQLSIPANKLEAIRKVLDQHDVDLKDQEESQLDFVDQFLFPHSNTASSKIADLETRTISGRLNKDDSQTRVGAYLIEEKIGEGGMGSVFRATHQRLDKTFAIKFLPTTKDSSEAEIARFEREIKVAGKLDHPNLIAASDAGTHQGQNYLVMELVNGPSLGQLLGANSNLPVNQACEIGRQAAMGLLYAHSLPLIHRDIKPSNIMIDQKGIVKVVDFGLASLHQRTDSSITKTGQIVGTVDFMAPEQAARNLEVGPEADVFSLGATLYKTFTGYTPFQQDSPLNILEKLSLLATENPVPVEQRNTPLPDDLSNLINRMLSRTPEDRPDLDEVIQTLKPYSDGAQIAQLVRDWSGILSQDESKATGFEHLATSPTKTEIPSNTNLHQKNQPKISRRTLLIGATACIGGIAGLSAWQLGLFKMSPVKVKTQPEADFLTCRSTYYELNRQDSHIVQSFYQMGEDLDQEAIESLIHIDYKANEVGDFIDPNIEVEVRFRINRRLDLDEGMIKAAADRHGLEHVVIQQQKKHQLAYIPKPANLDQKQVLQLWSTLYEFVEKNYDVASIGYPTETFDISKDMNAKMESESILSFRLN